MTDDLRPVVYCPTCQCDTIAGTDGRCLWCHRRIVHTRTCRCGALAVPKNTRCSRCMQEDRRNGVQMPMGRPRLPAQPVAPAASGCSVQTGSNTRREEAA